MDTQSNRYALIIGNNQYTDKTLQQLHTPGQDAKALEKVLADPDIGNFKVNVKLDPESDSLRREIERFFVEGKSTDTLLFYFSGHGVIEGYSGDLHLAVKDTDKSVLASTAIPGSFIRQIARKSLAKSKVIILDCCYSGAIATDEMPPKGDAAEAAFAKQFTGQGIIFLSASTAWQYALQGTNIQQLSPEVRSLFTHFLVRGLETSEADRDGNGIITIRELYDYVFEHVHKETPHQTPEISAFDQQGDIIIAKSVKSKIGDRLEQPQGLSTIEGTYQHALDHYEKKEWTEAEIWFSVVAREDAGYKEVPSLLAEAKRQLKLATIYNRGQKALETKDWETARDLFQEVLNTNPDYEKANDLYYTAHKEIELPKLYSQASRQLHNQDWDEAIATLTEIHDLDPHYKDVALLMEDTWRKKRLEEDYQRALKQYTKAERTDQESDWQEAIILLQKVADKEPGYGTVSPKLIHAKRRSAFFELSQRGEILFARKEWQEAVEYLKQATDIDSRDTALVTMLAEAQEKLGEQEADRHQKTRKLYDQGIEFYQLTKWGEAVSYLEAASAIEPNYANLQTKLSEARKRLRQQRIARIILAILNVILLTVVFAVFQNQIAKVGDDIAKRWSEIRVTPTPTIAISGIDRIEVWMDGGQLNLDRLPSLTGGKKVLLEVLVSDTNGKRYTSDNLMCKWSVAPIGDGDERIDTDQCKTRYTPSRNYSNQAVVVEVRGKEEQFKPGPPISMRFNITK